MYANGTARKRGIEGMGSNGMLAVSYSRQPVYPETLDLLEVFLFLSLDLFLFRPLLLLAGRSSGPDMS